MNHKPRINLPKQYGYLGAGPKRGIGAASSSAGGSAPPPAASYMLMENGTDHMLTEGGDLMILET